MGCEDLNDCVDLILAELQKKDKVELFVILIFSILCFFSLVLFVKLYFTIHVYIRDYLLKVRYSGAGILDDGSPQA